jgi:hypothetical protein
MHCELKDTRIGRATVERLKINQARQMEAHCRRRIHADFFP